MWASAIAKGQILANADAFFRDTRMVPTPFVRETARLASLFPELLCRINAKTILLDNFDDDDHLSSYDDIYH